MYRSFFIISIFFISCDNQETERVFDEKTEIISVEKEIEQYSELLPTELIDSIVSLFRPNYKVSKSKSIFPYTLKRLNNFDNSIELSFQSEKNLNFDLFYFTYKSTTEYDKAFFSLVNCFPTDCNTIRYGRNMKGIKTTPALFLFLDSSMLIINTDCYPNTKEWDSIIDLVQEIMPPYKRKIETGCGGPLIWDTINSEVVPPPASRSLSE